MSTIYFNSIDNSFWRAMPPEGGRELSEEEKSVVESALAHGDLPRFENGAWVVYTPDNPPADVLMHNMRHTRGVLLAESDWTQFPDTQEALTPELRAAWKDYRQQLRDIPSKYPDGRIPGWPAPPVA